MLRYLSECIKKDLIKKAILLSGPRQVGKTTFARSLVEGGEYLNYDIVGDRKAILAQAWRKDAPIVVLDEIHKFPKWKNFLKGVIDEFQNHPPLFITGSARLEVFRKAGDALTGRTFAYHLHPIDIKEACALEPKTSPESHLERLLTSGGFPESFFDPENAARLLRDRLSTVLREDLRDISVVSNLKGIELLVELLRDRVCGQIAYSNLAKDLSVSPPTIKTWIELLEKLYLVFMLRPYSKGLAKSIRKEPKCYFFDCSAPTNGEEARLENLAALALLKWCDFERDTTGRNLNLMYYRDTSEREVDFVITEDKDVLACIEVKSSDESPSQSLRYLTERIHPKHSIQLVKNATKSRDYGAIKVRPLGDWLSKFSL
jgi:predicted AAA+ superfamily ATPase